MANTNEKLFRTFSANLSKSQSALHCLQRLNLLSNIGIGYNGQGWEHLQHCIIFPLQKQYDKIVGFYGYPLHADQEPSYWPRRTGFYPRYPDVYTERLLLTDSVVSAAYLWQIPQIWERYTVLACYDNKGLTKEQRIAIASLQKLKEVILFFKGNASGQALAGKVGGQLSLSGVTFYQVDSSIEDAINNLGGSKCLDLLNSRTVYHSKEKERARAAEDRPQAVVLKEDATLPDKVEQLQTVPPVSGNDAKPKVNHSKIQELRPKLDLIDLAWIDEQQRRYGITDYELSLQLGQSQNYLYQIRAGKLKISKGNKAAIWHFFKRVE